MAEAATGSRALTFIFLTILIDTMGFGIVIPVLPDLIRTLTGEDYAHAATIFGWMLVTYAGLQFFFGPVMGNLSDRFGRRPVILLSLMAYGVDYLVTAFAPTIGWLFLGRAVAGMTGAVYVPSMAYIADVSRPEERAKNFGVVGAAFGTGFVLGPAIGGLIGELGPRAPFLASATLSAANTLYGYFVLPETLPPDRRRPLDLSRANPLGTFLSLRRYRAVTGIAAALFFWQLAHQVYPSTWSFFAKLRFNWSPGEIGLSLAYVGLTMAVVQGALTGRLVPRLGESRAVFVGLGAGVTAFVGNALATRGWMVYPVMTLGALQGITYPSMNAIMSKSVPADSQGELQGGVASLASVSAIVGPFAMTQTLSAFTRPDARWQFAGAAFTLAALLTCVSAWLMVRARVQRIVA